jgi:hypothetical protein
MVRSLLLVVFILAARGGALHFPMRSHPRATATAFEPRVNVSLVVGGISTPLVLAPDDALPELKIPDLVR